MPPSRNPDVYQQANALAHDLRIAGFTTHADEIDTCILAGMTSTEILMYLRFHLKALLATKDVTLSQALAADTRKLIRQISIILFKSNFGFVA